MGLQRVIDKLDSVRIRTALVPVARLADIQNDIIKFRENEKLNGYQKHIVDEKYVLDLPELDFTPKSIFIAATKYNLIRVKFFWRGKTVTDIGKSPEDETEIPNAIKSCGFSCAEVFWLPQKRLAIRSGLAEYGRNNITFTPDWGSFFGIDTYIADIPCGTDHVWRDAVCMDVCGSCGSSLHDCPTGAICEDRFLIDSERCLFHMLESGDPLPGWLPCDAVRSLNWCLRCQLKCAPNQKMLENIKEEIVFGEIETDLMLSGTPWESLPRETQVKMDQINLRDWRYAGIPRNLKIMLDNAV